MGDWLVQEVLQYFVGPVLDPVPRLLILVQTLVLRVPEVTAQQPVIVLAGRSLDVVQVGYVVVIMVAGVVLMARGGVQSDYTAKSLIERAVLGFVASHLAVWVVQQITRAANALIATLAPDSEAALERLDASKGMLEQIAKAPESILLLLVIQVVIVILLVSLLITWLSRFIRLALLTGLAPLALACHGLPWLDGVARAWWQSLGVVVVTVVAQAGALQFGLEMLLDPGSDLSGVGSFDHSDVLTNMLMILCLLIVVMRMPSIIGRFLGTGGTGNRSVVGMVLRYTMVNRALRSRTHPGGWVVRAVQARWRRRQFAAPTTAIWQWGDAARRLRPAPRLHTALALGQMSTRARATWQEELIRERREQQQRNARLRGRPALAQAQQPPRLAGQAKTARQLDAVIQMQARSVEAGRLLDESAPVRRARPPAPLPGRTAGNPTIVVRRAAPGTKPARSGGGTVFRRDRRPQTAPTRVTRVGQSPAGPSQVRPRSLRPVQRGGDQGVATGRQIPRNTRRADPTGGRARPAARHPSATYSRREQAVAPRAFRQPRTPPPPVRRRPRTPPPPPPGT
ncbi:hypothetical protein Kisp01_70620 [Kineosporia sp. NBRC 101677]|uniref:conjugal transfer protein TrbL family protein n=1 Tax=Kineosporia sp. NBRC 101677 TaxID=3032197 RepID=UPI0024A0CBCA|nr:conjugal transfer protein TrbL family protein [Kineosporia sp. NBRC 101677]GLY20048.1 hypothetical protein Kisp01_70620 [Kineosporia sp. NBRC 101677]